jgi:hypothetical protein
VVAELKAGVPEGLEAEADAWKAALAASTGEPYDPVDAALSDRLDAIDRQHGSARAGEFAARATGRATPIDTHVDAFLTSRGELRADTKARHEAAIGGLVGWLKRRGLPPTIQAVDRKLAVQYADELPPGRPDPKRLSLYWQWLVRREHARGDPWHGLSAPPRTRQGEPERPFEDDEVRRLLAGAAPPAMRDLMMVAALSGARLDAIIRMEIEGDCFIFPPQKKETKARRVPIHSALREQALALGSIAPWPWRNSMAASTAFTRYRRSVRSSEHPLGIGEEGGKRRRAVANFHSWRRWAISKMEQAGQPENVIAAVVGHRRPGLTFGRYSSGPSIEQLRACVESVRLPT